MYFVDEGYVITNAYIKKSFWKREVYYVVEMEKGTRYYQQELSKAIEEERYEDAAKIKAEFDCNEILLKETFNK